MMFHRTGIVVAHAITKSTKEVSDRETSTVIAFLVKIWLRNVEIKFVSWSDDVSQDMYRCCTRLYEVFELSHFQFFFARCVSILKIVVLDLDEYHIASTAIAFLVKIWLRKVEIKFVSWSDDVSQDMYRCCTRHYEVKEGGQWSRNKHCHRIPRKNLA